MAPGLFGQHKKREKHLRRSKLALQSAEVIRAASLHSDLIAGDPANEAAKAGHHIPDSCTDAAESKAGVEGCCRTPAAGLEKSRAQEDSNRHRDSESKTQTLFPEAFALWTAA